MSDSPKGSATKKAPLFPEEHVSRSRAGAVFARLLHGAGAGAVAYGLGIVSNLVLLPLYLRAWSVAVYGEWMALYSVVNYLSNLDFGVTAAGINAATMAYARGDWSEFKRVQGTAWAASVVIAAAGTVLVVLPFLFYFRVERWLNLKALSPSEARIVFCCLAVSLLLSIPGRQLISIYVTIGEFAKYQWLYNAFTFASCVTAAILLSGGAGPVLLAEVTLTVAFATIAAAGWLLRRRDPRLVPRLNAADWPTARRLAAPTAQFGISIFASALSIQGPVILLSRVLGGPAVALFTTTRTVANIIRQSVGLLRYPLRPELAALSATRSKAALGRLFRLAASLDTVVGVSLFAALWSGGCWFIRFWSRGRIEAEAGFLHLILISVLLEGFLIFLGSTGWATNRAQAQSLAQLASAVGSLLLAAALVASSGVSAVPLGAIPPLLLFVAPVAVRDACKNAGFSIRYVSARLILPIAVLCIGSAVFSQWVVDEGIRPEWLAGATSAFVTCVVALLVCGGIFLTGEDRHGLRARIVSRCAKGSYRESVFGTE